MLSRLKHPNICQIFDLIERDDGDVLILELVEGRSLREIISEGLDLTDALAIGRQLLEVLVAVHRQGIVHRDLKPGNVMVDPDSEAVKLLDFMGHQRWDVAPGGDRFLMVENSQDYRIVIVQNWFEELERLAPTTP